MTDMRRSLGFLPHLEAALKEYVAKGFRFHFIMVDPCGSLLHFVERELS